MPDQQMPEGSVQGALSQISMELGKQSTQLAVVIEKLTGLTAGMGDHENRIRVLETAKAKSMGAAAASGILSGGVATLIYWALQAHR